ncbi:hypothetical protein MJO28_015267 [Puccinia striiformis f. sp. tritici]|uniref:Uncharacterized protein n=1 Tax=Puccinia striiformis f. sp. tritici TaxID=168172 RepID=A0ACC0DS86_9BASI|nr:hypothetical protein MJO28_015267 [Puccinia striiformis f. sp. tritici]
MVDYDFIDQIYRFSAHLRFEGANNHQNPSRNENDIITFQRNIHDFRSIQLLSATPAKFQSRKSALRTDIDT